jgi:ATP-dependent Clp protease, protease subunit
MTNDQLSQIHDRLLKNRIIFLGVLIDEEAATEVVAKVLYLIDEDGSLPISLYVNSPGGSVPASFGIMDAIDQSTVPVKTVCVGQASGTAAMIVAHGSQGDRTALSRAMFRLVPLRMPARRFHAQDAGPSIENIEELVVATLAQDTGKAFSAVRGDMQASLILNARQALDYGLIDEIVSRD